eukprot:gene15456-37613_t
MSGFAHDTAEAEALMAEEPKVGAALENLAAAEAAAAGGLAGLRV